MVSNVGSDAITLSGLLEAFAKQGGATVNGNALTNGIITDGYLPTLGDMSNSWIALFSKIHQQYDPKAPFDGNVLYGEAVAYTFVQAMLKAGRNPTRADLVSAIEGGLPQGPAVAPYAYSASDHCGRHRRLHGRHQEWCLKYSRDRCWSRTRPRRVPSPPTREPNSRRRRVVSPHRDAASAIPPGMKQESAG